MPWNCLCSSEKERHKLEISAPILNRDDKRNAKILQNLAKDENRKAINPTLQRNVNQAEIIKTNNNYPDESKLHTKTSSKEKLRSKKTAKNAKDSHTQEERSKQAGNVKFSEDTIDPNSNASPPSHRAEPEEEDTTYSQLIFDRKVNRPNEPSINAGVQLESDPQTGHYDRLPFDKSLNRSVPGNITFQHPGANREAVYAVHQRQATQSHGQAYYHGKQNGTPATGVGMQSSDAIPFIDDDDVVSLVEKHNTHLRIQEANNNNSDNEYASSNRIITLHPKNIGSSQTIQRASTLHRTQLSNAIANPLDASQRQMVELNGHHQVVARSKVGTEANNQPGRAVGVHEFFSWNPSKGKLCQICHASALNGSNTVVKCRSCDLVCHLWCVPRMVPSVRYHDTAFIIYRKWLRAEDELAFPTVHKYTLTDVKTEDSITKPDYYLTDSECTYLNEADKRTDPDAVNRNKRKSRRRTRSLEKRKPTATNAEDNVAERFIATNPPSEGKDGKDAKDDGKLRLRANENKISIRVEANDDIAKGHQHQSKSSKLRINESQKAEGAGAEAEAVAETSDESDDFGSKGGSCYDIAAANGGVKMQDDGQQGADFTSADVHPQPRGSGLVITEPCDLKETKDTVPVISDKDKHKLGRVSLERQISCTSDESTADSYVHGKFFTADGGRNSSLRSSVRSATSVSSSNYSTSDRVSDADDVTSFDSGSTLQKSNEDRVDSSQQILPKLETPPWPIQTQPAPTSQHKKGASSPSTFRLDYVTERILAYILPAHSDAHDQYQKEVIPMLEQKHGKNYQLFNLETCISVITLERICELCKHIDKWLGSGQEKVVVLQDREDCQRLGATIIAFLEYLRICASNYQTRNINLNEDARAQNTIARNWMNLDMFSMKKFLESNIGPLRVPSYKRYVRYFSGLLSGQIKLNSSPLHLSYISIESPPLWLQYNGVSSKSEWNSFIKIYEGLQCVYTSDIHIIPITTRQFLYEIGNLRLRGDILIRCYQINSSDDGSAQSRTLLFSVQFHTCAIKTDDVVFGKEDLDYAYSDSRFPNDCKVSFHFNSGANNNNNFLFQSPLIRTERIHELAKTNSIEDLDLNSCHTEGPLDGSLYATILKSPKSSHCPSNLNNNNRSAKTIIVTDTSHQYGFDKSFDSIVDCKPINTSTPIKSSSRADFISGRSSFREASVPLPRSDYNTHIDSRPGTSQSNYHPHPPPTSSHHQTTSSFIQTIQSSDNRINQNGGSREYVRSPLTLSMDSGISSSGVPNRPTLASSVSPSSFPSQVSPQEDRHRELDDILSDMLSTVRDIPDFLDRKNSAHSINNQYGRSQSVVSHVSATASAPSPVYTLPIPNPPAQNTIREVVHGSHSYVSQDAVQRHSNHSNSYKQDRFDPYDTASTTTTLTPPPSESGRETPNLFSGYHSSTSNISLGHSRHQQPRRDPSATMSLQHNQVSPQTAQANSQHQSATYQRVVRTSSESHPPDVHAFEDEDNIPYHAREHSQPFTYGNLPSNGVHLNEVPGPENQPKDPRMIKAQSGLTSPMLVRRTFGGSAGGPSNDGSMYSTLRKTPTRNDFEEMLRERREKVMSEKYYISEKQPAASNGYHNYYNDPLKRSNTLDGFHRSTSNTELSGPTWLQLQQQKLRAKKNQQLKDDRKFFDEIHMEIRNRSLRSKNNVRYDGYASDTAAFDEVDYRRPLHVQTPYHTTNSSPERHYHTISTTTKTVTKERPFVAVKRSHETAKQDKLGSPPLSPLAILNASPLGHIAQAQQSNNIRNSNNNNNNSNSNNQNGLLSLAESSLNNGRARLVREESFSSYRSETDQDISIAGSPRPETPAFPVTPRTPYGLNGSVSPGIPPRSPTPHRRLYNSTWSLRSVKSTTSTLDRSKDLYGGVQKGLFPESANQNDTMYRSRMNSNASNANSEPQEVAPHLVKFVRDSSKFWYKPNLSREEAVDLLRNAPPGTFIVRDSATFKDAYGLVVRVAQPPPGVTASADGDELVRHFLVEPTTRGVRLKGCANEPVFTSLSALVYQHSITPLALSCRLIIPESDIQPNEMHTPAQKQLLTQGAACNVLHLYTCGTESLTGEEAVRRAVAQLFSITPLPVPTEVHFKVASQGITMTDNKRQKFFRKHYTAHNISFCGIDPEHRQWSVKNEEGVLPVSNKTIFAFVARRTPSSKDNQCHVFCDLAVQQPASAIVSFANKVLPTEKQINRNI